jgi:hypothetical protein
VGVVVCLYTIRLMIDKLADDVILIDWNGYISNYFGNFTIIFVIMCKSIILFGRVRCSL